MMKADLKHLDVVSLWVHYSQAVSPSPLPSPTTNHHWLSRLERKGTGKGWSWWDGSRVAPGKCFAPGRRRAKGRRRKAPPLALGKGVHIISAGQRTADIGAARGFEWDWPGLTKCGQS